MNVIAKSTLREFWEKHPDAETPLKEWYNIAVKANWQMPGNVTDAISNSRYIGNGRFIFKIKGNDYRLVVRIAFLPKHIYIRFVGSHTEYDKIDAKTI